MQNSINLGYMMRLGLLLKLSTYFQTSLVIQMHINEDLQNDTELNYHVTLPLLLW